MPYFYNPHKLEVSIPPICMALASIFAILSLIVSRFGSDHIPPGIFPSLSWAGDRYPESVFFSLAMVLAAVQVLFVYLLYDREFGFLVRSLLLLLVVLCIGGLLTLSTVSTSNNSAVHGAAACIAFFSLYVYVTLRLYFLWRKCKADSKWMQRFRQIMWILLGMFVLSVPVTVCCFVFFILFTTLGVGDPQSAYYLMFVIFEWIAAFVVGGMHIVTWGAYNIGHTNDLR